VRNTDLPGLKDWTDWSLKNRGDESPVLLFGLGEWEKFDIYFTIF
jgi:hypothetical protein